MKLTQSQIEARITMYDEVIGHLDLSVHETDLEIEQGKVVQAELEKLKDKFIQTCIKKGLYV
jgi:hypothetical protein